MNVRFPLLAFAMLTSALTGRAAEPTLAERLGYGPADRVLIINGDDAGMCHTANRATIESMEQGLMTSATIMVPCPWFGEVAEYARQHPERSFGVHLTHTSEWKHYRWGPVACRDQVPGLVDPEGNLWRSVQEVYRSGKPEEALIEGLAQVRKALAAGIDVTHLDSHMGTLQLDPRYLEVYVRLGLEFNLPLRMASQATMTRFGYPDVRAKVAAQGIVFTDDFVYDELPQAKGDVRGFWLRILKNLKPGVTELYIHAGQPTDELKAITGSWPTRSAEFETFTRDPEVRQLLETEKIIRISYRPLRDLQRKTRSTTPTP